MPNSKKYKDKDCAECGKTFSPNGPVSKTCGAECKANRNRRNERIRYVPVSSKKIRTCVSCSNEFEATTKKHVACSKDCRILYRSSDRARSKRSNHMIKTYGITIEDYDAQLNKQSWVCALCGRKCSWQDNLSVDHCHKSGANRGLLCSKCNKGLGLFEDNIEVLKLAVNYLQKGGIWNDTEL